MGRLYGKLRIINLTTIRQIHNIVNVRTNNGEKMKPTNQQCVRVYSFRSCFITGQGVSINSIDATGNRRAQIITEK